MTFKHHDKVLREILWGKGQRVPWDRLFQHTTPALPARIKIAGPHIPSFICITTENAEVWTRRPKEISISRDIVYSGALSHDPLFIQNWVNRNTFAETSKQRTVQWFHKQLFNSPLPAFPHKRSPNLPFLWKGHSFLCLWFEGQGEAEGTGRWH